MPEPLAVLPESGCDSISDQKNLTRTIPAYLSYSPIRRCLLTSGDKELLSVLYYASKDGICQLRHKDIAERLGCGIQAVKKRLQRVEKLGHLKREGNHRSQKIHLCHLPEDDDPNLALTIPECIWTRKDLSHSQKQILAVIHAFPNVKPKNWTWYPDRLGMNHQAYKLNLRKIFFKKFKIHHDNLVRLYTEPSKTLYPFCGGVGGEVCVLPKGSTCALTCANECSREDKKMIHPETRRFPDPYANLTSSPSKKPDKKPDPEIEDIWKSFPHTMDHKFPGKTYEMARRTIRALRLSPQRVLRSEEITHLTKWALSSKRDRKPRFTKQQIQDFITHTFSPSERIDIYQRLSNYHNKTYRVAAKGNASLASSLYNPFAEGCSLIMEVWYNPPKPIRIPLIAINEKLHPIVDMVLETIQKEDRQTESIVRKNIKHLYWVYEKTIRPNMAEETKYHYGDFRSYMRGFVDWAIDKYSGLEPNPGWFSSDSTPFKKWERIMREWTNASIETSDYLAELQQEL